MHALTQEILGHYQNRKSRARKAAFRDFLCKQLEAEGIACRLECSPIIHSVNMVVGDVEHAEYIFTAHYDTCAVLPFPNFIAPMNLLISIAYQFLLAFLMIMACMVIGVCTGVLLGPSMAVWCVPLFALAMVYMLYFGIANRHTANDNTSGVAVLVEAMLSMPLEARERTAFVFFDNEEPGMLGSYFFRRKHKSIMKHKPLLNFDCVSDGNHLLLALSRDFMQDTQLVERTRASLRLKDGFTSEFCAAKAVFYPSDHMHFAKAAGVVALQRKRGIGYYLGRIHTRHDTAFDEDNIETLRAFIVALCGNMALEA